MIFLLLLKKEIMFGPVNLKSSFELQYESTVFHHILADVHGFK